MEKGVFFSLASENVKTEEQGIALRACAFALRDSRAKPVRFPRNNVEFVVESVVPNK